MCIRDRINIRRRRRVHEDALGLVEQLVHRGLTGAGHGLICCLLYTSDAADERSSVDLGGRRIIKKKNKGTSKGERVIL